ncbi:MAG: DNA methyltransferase [Spartobacteria bacterium]|nr:DNA methyltransferase [Spartobacteria bacterium]
MIHDYLKSIEKEYKKGIATEHTYRPALKSLIEAIDPAICAVNEPKHVACGAPDYLISRRNQTLGYIEAKDIGVPLHTVERSEQLKRYLLALDNLLLTDYLEFRWYVNGELRQCARMADAHGDRLVIREQAIPQVETILREFLAHAPQTIRRPGELARRMANLAHIIRDIIIQAFEQGSASPLLEDWRNAFAETLMHELHHPDRIPDFADMFAQTIAYGLFSARVMDDTPDTFSRQEAQALIPKSNPFLRNFFYQITNPSLDDEPFAPFVDDLVSALAHTDMDRVLKDFGSARKSSDPVFHFYETFLAEYDPRLREARGVYYTPDPVVSYIVRSVDHVLKTKLKCPDGLADASTVTIPNYNPEKRTAKGSMRKTDTCHKVLILDPACGTGTFLYDIIAFIRDQFMQKNNAGMWPGYVKSSLLPRLFGFELMMAPYAIAHFKLSLQLAGRDLPDDQEKLWKYDMEQGDRLRVYLTNTLEDMHEMSGLPLFARWIAEETEAAAEVKRDLPIMVICGNPPYSYASDNNGAWITDLITDYKFVNGQPLGERNPKGLQDDYVKFIRFAQWRLDQSGGGVLAIISNNGYLDNPTFRGMRWSLMQSFNDIYVLNLHGSSKKKETAPDGGKDENVFDIQQGVCIGIFVKQPDLKRKCQIHYADLWGARQIKYDSLDKWDVSNTKWHKVSPEMPHFLFVPQDKSIQPEYIDQTGLIDIFSITSSGFKTHRDHFAVSFDRDEMVQRIDKMRDISLSDYEFSNLFNLKNTQSWNICNVRRYLRQDKMYKDSLIECSYRPFDERFCYFSSLTMDRPRPELLQHVVGKDNLCLGIGRQGIAVNDEIWSLLTVSRNPIDTNVFRRGGVNVSPLYLYPKPDELDFDAGAPRQPNLSKAFIEDFSTRLGLTFIPDGRGDMAETFGPEDVFYYMYAILHAPTYRTRYAEFLKIDFPRIPLTSDCKLFARLVQYGCNLVALHLMESPELEQSLTAYPVAGDNIIAKGYPKYTKNRVWINATQYFDGVPETVWTFTIGGYQVCEKWLKDRRERVLTFEDLTHYQKIVVALSRTAELMKEIDAAISHWPIT